MKLYGLEATVSAAGDIVNLADGKGRIAAYFIWNEGNDKAFQFSKPRADAQGRVKLKDLLAADYLQANIGVPIFSAKGKNILASSIPDHVRFYECLVSCEGQEQVFFLCKVLSYLPLVDKQRSSFRTLSEGEKILTQAVYRDDIEQEFFIARDAEFHERLVVSQGFVELCQREGLHIRFGAPV